MSVVGIGMDMVAVERIERILARHGDRWLKRCFRSEPVSPADGKGGLWTRADAVALAGNWAAKEAFLKALGADVSGIPYRDIEVAGCDQGPGELVLHGRARAALTEVGGNRIHLALSRGADFAVATVFIEE